ncbi:MULTISPECIES: sulfite exporter TauE/SafE family protein [unclassified Corynebacterium]|uniref:sulfite exporter TauE/SafE family protein n=1 Tax=unclassified Corynebacterium TaxID=2624378 RepID=UPI0035231CDE
MSVLSTVLITVVIVILGSCLQRISGMGFGLLVVPVLAILLGPADGVLVVNALAAVNAALTTWTVREYVDWRKVRLLAFPLFIGAIPGVFLIRAINAAPLQIIVGVLLLVALAVVLGGRRHIPHISGNGSLFSAGVIAGFMNTLAGAAGPAVTVYAQAARWPHQMLAATLQPIFVISGGLSFILKILLGASSVTAVPPALWPVAFVGMLVGIFSGTMLSRVIPREIARRTALSVAGLGGITAITQGIVSLAY